MPGTRKLGKTTDQRMAMLRQQVTDFLDNGKMETTLTRAKEIQPMAEKMITLGKKNDLAAYRQAMSFITREDVCKKVFKELAPSYAERNGGYTRITRTGVRRGDAAETAMIELVKCSDPKKERSPLPKAMDFFFLSPISPHFSPSLLPPPPPVCYTIPKERTLPVTAPRARERMVPCGE